MKPLQFLVAFVALAGMTSTVCAQRQKERGFALIPGTPVYLLEKQAVQEELKLTDEQIQKLEALLSDRPVVQSREELERTRPARAKKANEAIKSVLDEKQEKRLEELRIQREGVRSLFRTEVTDKLGLEQAQKNKITEIEGQHTSANRATLTKLREPRITPQERQKAFAEARERTKKTYADLLAVLTPAQKETFEKMKGEKFEFPR